MPLDAHAPERFPRQNNGVSAPARGWVVASSAAGHFAGNLAVDDAGAVFVTVHSLQRLDRYDPET
jgi:hypothetical protein